MEKFAKGVNLAYDSQLAGSGNAGAFRSLQANRMGAFGKALNSVVGQLGGSTNAGVFNSMVAAAEKAKPKPGERTIEQRLGRTQKYWEKNFKDREKSLVGRLMTGGLDAAGYLKVTAALQKQLAAGRGGTTTDASKPGATAKPIPVTIKDRVMLADAGTRGSQSHLEAIIKQKGGRLDVSFIDLQKQQLRTLQAIERNTGGGAGVGVV